MPRRIGGDDGGGGTGPPPGTQAAAAKLARLAAEDARGTVQVFQRDLPDVLGIGGLKFEGAGLTSTWDGPERRSVVTVQPFVLYGLAAGRPATPLGPCLYIATDTGVHSSWDGTTWRVVYVASAPLAHHASHENNGGDEVSVAGLSGLLADGQTPLAHVHAGSDIGSGTVAVARLGSGSPGSGNFLRGSGAWDAIAEGDVASLVSDLAGKQAALPNLTQLNLFPSFPVIGTSTNMSPATHGASVAKVYPFEVHRPVTINGIYIRTGNTDTACLIVGIFDSTGAQVLRTAALDTLAGFVIVTSGTTPGLPITLQPGTYYLATTNNNSASATNAFKVTTLLPAATLPRWGTLPATAGAMPASIDPTAITKTTGGWIAEIILSSVTT